MRASVEEFLKESGFRPEREMLVAAMHAFEDEAAKALAGEPSSLRMIDSHLPGCVDVQSLAGRPVIVVDAGGSTSGPLVCGACRADARLAPQPAFPKRTTAPRPSPVGHPAI